MEFKDRLRELRGKRTQKEIAKLLGVPLNSYNNWENGREPSYAVLKKIAEFHHITVDYLIGYSDCTHDTKNLSKTYGLTDKALYALDKLQNDSTNKYFGRVVISLLNELLESETSISNLNHDILMRDPVLRRTLSHPIKPTQMLTDLTNHVLTTVQEVSDLNTYIDSCEDDILENIRDAIIQKNTNLIAQMIQTWLFYLCDNPPEEFFDHSLDEE